MNKATVTSPKAMREDQVREDIAMTPLQRLELAFQISDFAVAFDREREPSNQNTSSIQWIELHKVSTPNERNAR